MKTTLLASLAVVVSSCTYRWAKPDFDAAQFDRDRSECQTSARHGYDSDSDAYEACMGRKGYTLEHRPLYHR